MPKRKSWTDEELVAAVRNAQSYRSVIKLLGLVPAGENYLQVKSQIHAMNLNTSHFLGKGWNKNWQFNPRIPRKSLEEILVKNSSYQSFHLKKRLFAKGIKLPQCELCGWCQLSADGRLPLELDHMNGVHSDNRIENLRILCPNCHSLQSTHRGRNKKVHLVKQARVS